MSALEDDVEMLETAMRLFFQTMKRPQNWADVTAEAGISMDRPAAVILHTLIDHNKLRVQDLAEQLGIEAPSVTRKTQELERDGYLRRVPDPRDRRAISLQVTPRGQEANERLWKVQRERISRAFKNWEPEQRRQFVELFQRYSSELATNNQTK